MSHKDKVPSSYISKMEELIKTIYSDKGMTTNQKVLFFRFAELLASEQKLKIQFSDALSENKNK